MKANRKGFTLIELMIVVAIIGILAAIAIPKFADLIRKSNEGATKGNLGSVRSAVSIYYGEMEGTYPANWAYLTTKYLDVIPEAKNYYHGNSSAYTGGSVQPDVSGWFYQSGNGSVLVACTHSDTKNLIISTW